MPDGFVHVSIVTTCRQVTMSFYPFLHGDTPMVEVAHKRGPDALPLLSPPPPPPTTTLYLFLPVGEALHISIHMQATAQPTTTTQQVQAARGLNVPDAALRKGVDRAYCLSKALTFSSECGLEQLLVMSAFQGFIDQYPGAGLAAWKQAIFGFRERYPGAVRDAGVPVHMVCHHASPMAMATNLARVSTSPPDILAGVVELLSMLSSSCPADACTRAKSAGERDILRLGRKLEKDQVSLALRTLDAAVVKAVRGATEGMHDEMTQQARDLARHIRDLEERSEMAQRAARLVGDAIEGGAVTRERLAWAARSIVRHRNCRESGSQERTDVERAAAILDLVPATSVDPRADVGALKAAFGIVRTLSTRVSESTAYDILAQCALAET
ncbi:SMC N incomplete domain containing protein [Pandoravirus quercus]|uniref:SMC N incomplete domain containing protein n=1 Tax=Pandoravirus quercus TaxID=2107709 RepID=A0A2U7U9N0_9VIRU|nr:SMC N incomplete domain containing protein [Pandoravirus quercus]AVK75095.1 SMC N incomplete domain containing protein [Pandoravirus quercus]